MTADVIELPSLSDALVLTRARYPTIDAFGVRPYRGEFNRAEMPREAGPFEINGREYGTAAAFFALCMPAKKSPRPGLNSYHIKHIIESWCRAHGNPQYIANGAAIVAPVALGFPTWRDEARDSPNVSIGIRRRLWQTMIADALREPATR